MASRRSVNIVRMWPGYTAYFGRKARAGFDLGRRAVCAAAGAMGYTVGVIFLRPPSLMPKRRSMEPACRHVHRG